MASVTGWSWETCEDELTVTRLQALGREWKHNPPVAYLLAAFVGYKYEEPKGIEDFLSLIGGDGVLRIPT